MGNSTRKFDVSPILHIDIKNMLRQRMLVKSPIDPGNSMGQYAVLIRLIPLHPFVVVLGFKYPVVLPISPVYLLGSRISG